MNDFIECDVSIIETLSRKSSVNVENYNVVEDEDGMLSKYPDKDVNFKELYNEQHYSIKELLEILKNDCKTKLRNTQSPKKAKYLQGIIDDCENWVLEEIEVEH